MFSKRSILPSMRYPVQHIDEATLSELLKEPDGIVGTEWLMTNNHREINLVAPVKESVEQGEKELTSIGGMIAGYTVKLSLPEFLPVLIQSQSSVFQDFDLKENELVWAQLIMQYRNVEWRQSMISQYGCYRDGIDIPTRFSVIQRMQSNLIYYLDKLSGFNSERSRAQDIEQKILDDGYLCEIRVLIQSEDLETIVEQVKRSLDRFMYYNQFILMPVTKVQKLIDCMGDATFYGSRFHLGTHEIFSLLGVKGSSIEVDPSIVETPIAEEEVDDSKKELESAIQKAVHQVGILSTNKRLNTIDYFSGVRMKMVTADIPKGLTFTSFRNKVDDLSAALAEPSLSVVAGRSPNSVCFMLPLEKGKRKIIPLSQLTNTKQFKNYADKHALPLCIGSDLFSKPIYEALEESPHLLIAGSTNSGKSVFLNTILTTLLKVKTVDELNVYIIDPKEVEFTEYENRQHVKEIVTDIELAQPLLSKLITEMNRRYSVMKAMHVKNIKEYNQVSHDSLSYIVCLIDEFSELFILKPETEEQVQLLAQKARSAGIHLIIATQRPDANTISGTIKANFPSRISFQLKNNNDYRTVFGSGIPFSNLLGKGDGVMSYVGETEEFIRFQAPISDQELPSDKPIDKLRNLIINTKETRIRELQRMMGIGINVVSDLVRQLVEEGFLIKTNKGYIINSNYDT